MDERIDIVSKNGQSLNKTALKSEVHAKGYYHNTAHVWLYTDEGQILLQQRAASKIICPLLWDVSVSGHVDAGETITVAAIRESHEEIGITLKLEDLQKIGVFECFQHYSNGIIDNEFHHVFISKLNVSLDALEPQENEVEALKLVSFDMFENLLDNSKNNSHFVSTNSSYYNFVLERIKEAVKN